MEKPASPKNIHNQSNNKKGNYDISYKRLQKPACKNKWELPDILESDIMWANMNERTNEWLAEHFSVMLMESRFYSLQEILEMTALYTSLSSRFDTSVTPLPPERQQTISRQARTFFPQCLGSGPVYLSITMETDVFLCLQLPRASTLKCCLLAQRCC